MACQIKHTLEKLLYFVVELFDSDAVHINGFDRHSVILLGSLGLSFVHRSLGPLGSTSR